jgi:hypothetical protein
MIIIKCAKGPTKDVFSVNLTVKIREYFFQLITGLTEKNNMPNQIQKSGRSYSWTLNTSFSPNGPIENKLSEERSLKNPTKDSNELSSLRQKVAQLTSENKELTLENRGLKRQLKEKGQSCCKTIFTCQRRNNQKKF